MKKEYTPEYFRAMGWPPVFINWIMGGAPEDWADVAIITLGQEATTLCQREGCPERAGVVLGAALSMMAARTETLRAEVSTLIMELPEDQVAQTVPITIAQLEKMIEERGQKREAQAASREKFQNLLEESEEGESAGMTPRNATLGPA